MKLETTFYFASGKDPKEITHAIFEIIHPGFTYLDGQTFLEVLGRDPQYQEYVDECDGLTITAAQAHDASTLVVFEFDKGYRSKANITYTLNDWFEVAGEAYELTVMDEIYMDGTAPLNDMETVAALREAAPKVYGMVSRFLPEGVLPKD